MTKLLLWSGPAVLFYLGLLPALCLAIDRALGLRFAAPLPLSLAASLLAMGGVALAAWCAGLFSNVGRGTPNPIRPPSVLVAIGPYRYSRNPMMLGGWAAGIGLAIALASPALLAVNLLIVAAGVLYVRVWEEPRLERRFGHPYLEYCARVPRWVPCHGLSRYA